jgi:hypothetical protein
MSDTDPLVIVRQGRWWRSKLTWLHILMTVSGLGALALHYVPANGRIAPALAAIIGAVGIVLRVWFTSAPVTDYAAAQAEEK